MLSIHVSAHDVVVEGFLRKIQNCAFLTIAQRAHIVSNSLRTNEA